ncbi:uncharacterized protein Dvar_43670 [Desulfosarcina variabilis str. Montpellier]
MIEKDGASFFMHESSIRDDGAKIGKGSKIWNFSHVMHGK